MRARRTSHIDMIHLAGGLRLQGTARDVVESEGTAHVVAEATVSADLDRTHHLLGLETTPSDGRVGALVGLLVGPGFRAAVDTALADDEDRASPLYLLLDDLPVAALISGYSHLYNGKVSRSAVANGLVREDICAGWRSEGTMLVSLRETGTIPVPLGPPATALATEDDPLGWHEVGPLPPGAMRRRRLVEVTGDEPHRVFAMFRD